ncbi:MAG TPA: M56 family metallopeptidase [Rhizomicrobium sp.]|nr:M56 family metallopeptidase [Rhizomicrobium sp.]
MTLLSFFSAATLYDLGWTLLHFLWQGLLLAALLEVALPLLTGARARHNAAFAVLLLMAVTPVATFLVLHGQGSGLADAVPAVMMPALLAGGVAYDLSPAVPALNWPAWLVLLWFAGMAGLSLRALAGWWLAESLRRRDTMALPAELLARCEELAARLAVSRAVRFLQSSRVDVPVMIGWFRPVILLPISAIAGLPPQQLDALVMHELAHIRRHDAFINILLLGCETVLFYHPAVWWVGRRIRIERENCCDDLAVAHCGDAVLYVEAMTTLAGRVLSGGMALAADGGSLKDRAARLLGVPSDGRRYGLPAMAGLVLAGLAAGGVAMAQPAADNPGQAQPVLAVQENTRIDAVIFKGNSRISQRDLATEICGPDRIGGDHCLRAGDILTRARAETAVNQLKELYRRSGKYFARIDATSNSNLLTFSIQEGPTVGVARIDFEGNKAFDAATLRAVIATRESAWYQPFSTDDNFDPDRVAYDRELLRRFYAAKGFANLEVGGPKVLLTPDRRKFNITFYLNETGQRAAASWEQRAEAPLPHATNRDISIVVTDDKGQVPNLTLYATNVSTQPGGMLTVFEGNAVAQQGDMRLRADTIRAELGPSIHPALPGKLMRLIADGNVELTTPGGTRRTDHLEIDMKENALQIDAYPGAVKRAAATTMSPARALLRLHSGDIVRMAMQMRGPATSRSSREDMSRAPVPKLASSRISAR